ncbi:putative cobalt-precorrin-6A synthase (deacetylating) [Candidatus Competibacter denitrificans Run_A_D11]|uniref:Cobalt-precorrin-5B C(1)-methyltransferase n=1 Tax=Candidatus Competibacter denitrificans Run_A_D11 TaxID=1400863 RepID=W6MDR6_9GAMM|nr:cobalt-precorrin-5B (C(1))-methyltransferase [Candidatus Competibacter denitrificans]CDI03328.1 putative cobalt-precorrin-6A synthase (deacetylating) [Candidatus Competibacter denitrificans Run_A_D11]HCK80037.1 cobalt-precorrin-5B (C(1))-methyltransferase [Candidatus Competibacteraceae bacterium]HRC68939.1 cobalt-precorrin-5B (C(1))-methyltransferase [Candidatus Competibacter denitrificans]
MSEENIVGHALKPARVRKGDSRRARGNRTGFTTGACAAAAAKAATVGLLTGAVPDSIVCQLPNGQAVTFAVTEGRLDGSGETRTAHAVVIKDAGDDPDATHGAHLTADVCLLPDQAGEIALKGGPGVGVVTKEGLGLAVGGPAINPVPQRNIRANLRAVAAELLATAGLEVTISVPGGETIAQKTLNARLGILGGISILGTTGIVRPYSTAAFRASVVQAIEVAANQRQTAVVFTTGGRTEKFAMRQLPDLDESCFVQMGDFVKAAFTTAVQRNFTAIYLGVMVGKLTKLCQGLSVTHAWRAPVDRVILAEAAQAVAAPDALIEAIRAAETARFAAEQLARLGLTVAFHRQLALRAIRSLKTQYPGGYQLTVLVCDFEGQFICRVAEENIL